MSHVIGNYGHARYCLLTDLIPKNGWIAFRRPVVGYLNEVDWYVRMLDIDKFHHFGVVGIAEKDSSSFLLPKALPKSKILILICANIDVSD